MEVEALKSIYGEQFTTDGGKGDEPISYEVKLEPKNIKIIFTIPGKYPEVPPAISITLDNQPVYTELESLLYNSAQEYRGEVMIYNLVEEATSWIQKQKVTEQIPSQGEESSLVNVDNICKFFLEGKCRFGSKCRNKHEGITSSKSDNVDESLHSKISGDDTDTEVCPPTTNHKEMTKGASKSDNNSANRNNQKKESNGSTKKPPMKTASDVISRIMWDDELQPKDFTVGYLDRFIGIVEKGFSEFSWEDLASVDHFVDLAIPRHRIQYFKYCGEIVWDKRERIDKVYGSTGSKETILDVKKRIGGSNKEESSVEDSVEVFVADESRCTMSELPTCTFLKEKSGPNYFIAVQISDSEIITNIMKIQNVIRTEMGPEGEYKLMPTSKLHLTLLMLTLHSEDDVTTAKNILKSIQPVLVSLLPLSHKLKFNGLGQFYNRILYASLEPDARLSKLVQVLKFKFSRAEISLEENYDVFVPHVTIMKGTSKNFGTNDQLQKKVSNLVKASHEIGEQSVHSLVLFSRFLPRNDDGSYHKISTVENSLKSLSSTLPKKLLQRLNDLFESGKLCEDDRSEIQALIQSGDAAKLDMGLRRLANLDNLSEDKMVLIMRGIPGSGKTHLIENSAEACEDQKGYAYCSARQLFHKAGGSAPDAAELNIAEAYCRSCFMDAMATERRFVVVDGVHTKCWEYAVYKYLARAFGYACHVLEIRVTKPEDIKLCLYNADPGVQMEELLEGLQDWEDDPAAVVMEPWFKKPDALRHESISLKQLLKT